MKRVIIVDDEPAAIGKLEKMLKETGAVEICGTFVDPAAALDYIRDNQADIAFLDIEMPRISGIELADRMIDLQSRINIVFVTAYSEYAVEAFRCHAMDYLLKPVEKERLAITISRFADSPDVPDITPHTVSVRCFGSFTVSIDGTTLKFRTSKAEELFAYLIDNNGHSVHRNHIMDAFWEDYDGDRALILFNTTLHYLKKAFMQYGVKLNILHRRGSYSLDMSGITCDAVSFLEKISSLKTISEDNAADFEAAIRMYTGNYFDQNDYDWAYQKRLDVRQHYVRLVITLARFYIENGHDKKALDTLVGGIKYAPVDKNINLLLLKLLKKKKDDVSMQSYFQLYKDKLETEFGLEPDDAFLALFNLT